MVVAWHFWKLHVDKAGHCRFRVGALIEFTMLFSFKSHGIARNVHRNKLDVTPLMVVADEMSESQSDGADAVKCAICRMYITRDVYLNEPLSICAAAYARKIELCKHAKLLCLLGRISI